MHASLKNTQDNAVSFLNEHKGYLIPVPDGLITSRRAHKTDYQAVMPSFIFNRVGAVEEQLLHMDQRWQSHYLEDFMGSLSVFVNFPTTTLKKDRYQINIIRGSHIAHRLMLLATSIEELEKMRSIFVSAGLGWDERETVVECPWTQYMVASAQLFHGGSQKRLHQYNDVTLLAFTYVQSPTSAGVDGGGAPPCLSSDYHDVMFDIPSERWYRPHYNTKKRNR